MPSITMASAPSRTSRLANASAGAKHSTRVPASLILRIAADGGRPPASTTWLTRAAMQASISASSSGCMVMRLTPNGLSVSARVAAISPARSAGVMEPQAITPNPPPLEMAATRSCSDTQVMAPPMMA